MKYLNIENPALFRGEWEAFFVEVIDWEKRKWRIEPTPYVWRFLPDGTMRIGSAEDDGLRYGYSPRDRLLYLDEESGDRLRGRRALFRATYAREVGVACAVGGDQRHRRSARYPDDAVAPLPEEERRDDRGMKYAFIPIIS